MDLHRMTVAELGRQLDARTVSSVELATHLLARVASHQQLGAFLCTDESVALGQAREADARRARGETGALLLHPQPSIRESP